ncbi:MAG: copper resistance protein CopC [Actinomycetota bacterium]
MRHRSLAAISTILLVMVVSLAAVAAVSLGAVGVARAHSGLAAASPGPGAIVGGDIQLIQLFYGDLIVEFDATVTDPDGVELDAEAVMTSEITAEIRLAEPLSTPGEYAVRHTVLSIDDDVVPAAYLFTFDPDADPPILIFVEESDDEGWAWWAWLLIGVGVLLIVVLAVRLVLAIRRSRSPSDSIDDDATDADAATVR